MLCKHRVSSRFQSISDDMRTKIGHRMPVVKGFLVDSIECKQNDVGVLGAGYGLKIRVSVVQFRPWPPFTCSGRSDRGRSGPAADGVVSTKCQNVDMSAPKCRCCRRALGFTVSIKFLSISDKLIDRHKALISKDY